MQNIAILLWSLAGPATWIICLIDTWSSRASVLVKILLSVTLDPILAVIWPVTWMLWLGGALFGQENSLTLLF